MDKLPIDDETCVIVLTGAGVSAESGIQTFRDSGGLWEGHDVEAVATPEGFKKDPDLVWRFYSERRKQAGQALPNLAHLKLAELGDRLGPRFLLVTQNVDALHVRAGSKRVIEMHGNLYRTRCSRKKCKRDVTVDANVYETTPLCEKCGENLRPHIVWFGENLDPTHIERIERFMQYPRPTLFLAIGTSGSVYPAAGLVRLAKQHGITSYLINKDVAENEADFDVVLRGSACDVLSEVL